MTIKIYVTRNVSVFADIPKELLTKLEKVYVFDIDFSVLSLCDVFVAYDKGDDGSIIINYSDVEMSCDEHEFDFVFVTVIEEIAVKKSNNYIYHGSAVIYDNAYTVSFVGSSGSGKTTIVDNLEYYNSKFKRISDDLLFVDDTRLYKNYLPTKIKISNSINDIGFKSIKPSTVLDVTAHGEMFDLTIVVSVNYCASGINSFTRLNTFESIETLISNSRSAPNNFNLMQNITNIVKRIPIYSLNYYDDCYAVKCLINALELRNT